MRRSLLVGALCALCTCAPAVNRSDTSTMPTDVLEKSDPAADTSQNPVTYVGGDDFDLSIPGCGYSVDPVAPTGSTSIGCGACLGCSSSDPGSLMPLLAVAFVLRRRRRSLRTSGVSRTSRTLRVSESNVAVPA